jgi:hypothetical protein
MPITFTCRCGNTLRTADSNAGKPGKCPACSMPFIVPQSDGRAESTHADNSDYPLRRVTRQPVREKSRFDGLSADDVQLRPRLSEEDAEQKAERRRHRMPHALLADEEDEAPRGPRPKRPLVMVGAGLLMMLGSGLWFRLAVELGWNVPLLQAPVVFFAGLLLVAIGGLRYYLQR